MIEKKIKYEVNIEKPSKTKPVKQGGVFNYLGKQKTVNAPRHWRSSPKHPIAHLSYITKDEEKILIDLNLYGSLKGKPNRGPFGLPSLQGSGSGSGGDGGSSGGDSGGDSGQGDSGPGGSDDGSGHGGPGAGDSGPGGSDDGTGHGGPGPGPGADDGGYSGFGIGPNAEAEAAASNAAAEAAAAEAEVDMSMPAMQTVAEKAMAQVQNTFSVPGIIGGLIGMATGVPGGFSIGSTIGSNVGRGVTGPSDDTQESTSVQSGPSQSPSGGGGISTIAEYAPTYNPDTGNPTMDAYIRRLRLNLGLPV
jgi:hypothetical protein